MTMKKAISKANSPPPIKPTNARILVRHTLVINAVGLNETNDPDQIEVLRP